MPKFKVISVADGSIPVCVLTTRNERGRIDYVKVRDMIAENASIFVGKDILVATSNRDIIPQDILFETEPDTDAEGLPIRTWKYHVLSAADGVLPVCVFTVHDEEGRMDHLYVHDMTAVNAVPFVGEEVFVTVVNKEVRPRDLKMKKYEIFPTPPMEDYDDEEEEPEVVVELALEEGQTTVADALLDGLPDEVSEVSVEEHLPRGLLYWCERCGHTHRHASMIGKKHWREPEEKT